MHISCPFSFELPSTYPPSPCLRHCPEQLSTMGTPSRTRLSAGRRSRIYPRETYSAWRCPFRSLKPARCRSLAAESLRQSSVPTDSYGVVARAVLRQVWQYTAGNWGSTNAGFTLRTGLAGQRLTHLHTSPLSRHALVPLPFGVR